MNQTLQGTIVVGIAFAATALSVGASQYGFAVFIAPLESTYGWSRTEISTSLSFAAVSGLAAPFIGRAMDRFGVRPIIVFSLCVGGVSFWFRPHMTELWHWYALSFLQFIAFAGATVLPTGKLVAVWFARTRGRVMGIAAMGNNVGGLVVPPMMAAALVYASWREGFTVLALASFGLALAALFFVNERVSVSERAEGDMGAGGEKASVLRVDEGLTAGQAIRLPAFYAVVIAVMFGSFTYAAMLPHVYAHLLTGGMTIESASFTLGTLAIGGIVGKLVFGYLAERVGARQAAIVNLCGQAVFATLLGLADNHTTLSLMTPLFGVCMGGFGVLIALLVQDTFGLRYFGSIMGLVNTSNAVSFGLGPVIAGLSYDWTGAYTVGFIFTAGLFATGALVLFLVPTPTRSIAPTR